MTRAAPTEADAARASGTAADATERRLDAVRAAMQGAAADAMLLTHPASVRYVSAFSTPADGRVLVLPDEAWLVTDARYDVQAAEESTLPVHLTHEWAAWIAERVRGGQLAVEAEHMTLAQHAGLADALGRSATPLRGIVAHERRLKDAGEVQRIREAARITDAAFATVVERDLRPGVREIDVALALESEMRRLGAESAAFDIIVASGPRSAMPHGVASSRAIEDGDLVTIDMGARVGGYHADLTRAVAVGAVSERLRALFEAVLRAQERALAAIRPGLSGVDADAIARTSLAEEGLADAFVHSLGHGVGLEIHEAPRLSARSGDTLEAGAVVTVEPGVYLPGVGGVRIEDLVLVTDDGHEVLSGTPKGFRSV